MQSRSKRRGGKTTPAKSIKTKLPNASTATAYHEAGHAVAAVVFDYGNQESEVTIVPKGDALGFYSHPPPLMQGCRNKRQLRRIAEQMCIGSYAGMAAERLIDPSPPSFHGDDDERRVRELCQDYGIAPRRAKFIGDEACDRQLEKFKSMA